MTGGNSPDLAWPSVVSGFAFIEEGQVISSTYNFTDLGSVSSYCWSSAVGACCCTTGSSFVSWSGITTNFDQPWEH